MTKKKQTTEFASRVFASLVRVDWSAVKEGRAMAPAFNEIWPDRGVDDTEKVPGMVVPIGGKNFVLLRDGSGLTLDFDRKALRVTELKKDDRKRAIEAVAASAGQQDDPTIESKQLERVKELLLLLGRLTSRDRLFVVSDRRNRRGLRKIKAVDAGKAKKAELQVSVHEKMPVTVAFNFVKNDEKKLTRWNTSQVKQWIKVLNQIFTPQTNVVLHDIVSREVTVRDLSGPVTKRQWQQVSEKRTSRAELNIFLVGQWVSQGIHDDPNGSYFPKTEDAVVDDRPTEQLLLQTMSHEIGHHLGGADISNRPELLMNPSPRKGSKISHQQALNWNPL